MVDLDYAEVRGRLAVTVGDTDVDLDTNPDVQWCDSGTVRFTPLLTSVHVLDVAEGPFMAGNAPIEATIGADGRLMYDGQPFVMLLDLGSTKVNPMVPRNIASYKVDFFNITSQGQNVSFSSFTFHPLPTQTNDLTLLAPLPTGSGTAIVQGPVGPQGEMGPIGETGPQGPQGIQGIQGVQGVKGDTGDTGPQGIQGIQGIQGEIGPIGPQGIQGEVGPVGPAGLEWRGVWDSGTDYVADDAVMHNFQSWFAAVDPPLGEVPSDTSTYWQVLAARGAQGIQGIQGIQGPIGPEGPQGIQGIQGIQGEVGPIGPAGIVWTGAWNSATAYAVNEGVTHLGSSYRRIVAGTTATAPGSDPTNWELLAAKGTDGAGTIMTVNGDSGPNVVLDAADVGAVPAGSAVLLSTDQTIAGVKTFSSNVKVDLGAGFSSALDHANLKFSRPDASYISATTTGGYIRINATNASPGDTSVAKFALGATELSGTLAVTGAITGGSTLTTTGAITAGGTGFSGPGTNLTALNASALASGMVPYARLPEVDLDARYVNMTGDETIAGIKTFTGARVKIDPPTGVNAALEIGRTDGTAGTPYIDFNSGATATDYDARIIASGGNGVSGNGTLQLLANGNILLTSTAGVIANGPVTAAGSGFSGPGANITGITAAQVGAAPTVHGHVLTDANITGTLAIAKGGTGATTAATALTNLGVTATAAELNVLDGILPTVTELNFVDGVTSSIQTQLNAKVGTSGNENVAGEKNFTDYASFAIGTKRVSTLGSIAGNYTETSNHLHSGAGNNIFHREWMRRRSAGADWATTDLVDGISIDSSYVTPDTSRTWWRRHAQSGLQEWGDQGSIAFEVRPASVSSWKPHTFNSAIIENWANASGTSGTVTLDTSVAAVFTLQPTGNVTTLVLSNPPPTGKVITVQLRVYQGATPYSIATPSGGIFFGSASPTQVANKQCLFTYVSTDAGASWMCSAAVQV